ncbi:MAG: tetratricopeptide repeat protein [Treponema sp.]|jgi:putative GTP pyrophosphokinase|nr:tetratricopeptide repeat protein [Treponema sp.]
MIDTSISSSISPPDRSKLKSEFEKYEKTRHLIVSELEEQIKNILSSIDSNVAVSGRMKSFTSYFTKYIRLLKEGQNIPLITDLMGVRIICPFINDLQSAEEKINGMFKVIEREKKGHHKFTEFGYESMHLLIEIPQSILEKHGNPGTNIAEIQIRTILQDAWAEVEHELVYKAEFSLFSESMKRKLAAVNASLTLADIIFQDIRELQRKFIKEIEIRRDSFFYKVEEITDHFLLTNEYEHTEKRSIHIDPSMDSIYKDQDNDNFSIDQLLVNALTAHNQKRFNEAINLYSRIIELKPDRDIICSIIYKHRGMLYFACSQYEQAIDDFNSSFSHDPTSYKAVYYRGLVRSVLEQYSQAIDDYSLSLSINPYQSFCLFRRGQAFFHCGDYPKGLSDCESSLALDPDNESVISFKKLILEKLSL